MEILRKAVLGETTNDGPSMQISQSSSLASQQHTLSHPSSNSTLNSQDSQLSLTTSQGPGIEEVEDDEEEDNDHRIVDSSLIES